jgi:SAM-dependent methyltransferase
MRTAWHTTHQVEPKPELFASDYGTWFQDQLVVAAYPLRPPYPEETIQLLADLVLDPPRCVLDVGCGTGELARRLAPLLEHVVAVDASAPMLAAGSLAPGGAAPNLLWIHTRVEDVPLEAGAYGLVTAGESLHWLEWDTVMPRFAQALAPGGMLAIVDRNWDGPPDLRERLLPVFKRFSQVRTWQTVSLLDELQKRGLFEVVGQRRCGPTAWAPTVDEYVEARHSQRSFSRTHMGEATAAAFDAELRGVINAACAAGEIERTGDTLRLAASATVTWGHPAAA